MNKTLSSDQDSCYTSYEITERERKLIDFIRELEFGSLSVEVQRGEPVVIRQPLKTVKL
ncbi:DUF2292 domain-containing protein [Dehalococcoidia bacterium]|nr:DUF2292 domain-containing protein [Dehalococcoidia bacterium]